jgi:hypothetical protein
MRITSFATGPRGAGERLLLNLRGSYQALAQLTRRYALTMDRQMSEADTCAQRCQDAAESAGKPKPKQRYTSSDARRAYMRDLMRQRRAAARAQLMTGEGDGI